MLMCPVQVRVLFYATVSAAALLTSSLSPALAQDSACRVALQRRVQACAQSCLDRAKAAVDPEVRGRILGYGCTTNCTKIEMFNGHTCPS